MAANLPAELNEAQARLKELTDAAVDLHDAVAEETMEADTWEAWLYLGAILREHAGGGER